MGQRMVKNAYRLIFILSVLACLLILIVSLFTNYSGAPDKTKIQTRINKPYYIDAPPSSYQFWRIYRLEDKNPLSDLIGELKDKALYFRWSAAAALGRIGPEAVPALIAALKDENEHVRESAADVLGDIGPEAKAAVPALIEALKDKDEGVRWRAARALGDIRSEAKDAVPALIEAIKDDDIRWSAAAALGRIGPEAVTALIAALKDENEHVRESAADVLGDIGPEAKAAVPALIEALKDKVEGVRWSAAAALGRIGPEAVPALIAALKDENEHVRDSAADVLGDIGPEAKAAVPALIEALKDKVEGDRWSAAAALGRIGPEAVPALIAALKDENEHVRDSAADVLGDIGPEAKAAVPALIEAIKDDDIRWSAENALGEIGPEAVPALVEALKDKDSGVRERATMALGKIGPEAVPALVEALKDKDSGVRERAAMALGRIGPEAKSAVSALIEALKDKNSGVRERAAMGLGEIGPEAKSAVSALIEALKDKDSGVREQAAMGLGEIGLEAKSAVSALTEALKGKVIYLHKKAADALGKIAFALGDAKAIDMIKDLEAAKKALSAYPELEEYEKEVTRAIERLKFFEQINPPLWENIRKWVLENKLKSALVLVYIFWAVVFLSVFWLRPLALLRINQVLKPMDIQIKSVKLPLRFLLLIGLLNYLPRVLDAWVKAYIATCRERFSKNPTVGNRRIHISVPVEFDSKTVPELTPKLLHPTFARQVNCLLIRGEGGSGKTSLACQIAKWAMSKDKDKRLCTHLMLPVLIEELSSEKGQSAFMNTVGRKLQYLTDQANPISEELLEHLLRQRRVMVIVDHLSEMNEGTRKLIDPGQKGFAINAFVVTSRLKETLGGINKTVIKPLRIAGNRLSSFMEAYLIQNGKRELFDDPEFFEACRRLSEMVGDRDITVLLAKLYADQMIASKEGFTDDKLPDNIPDLMLAYLNELNRNVPAENRMGDTTIHQTAKILAWESLKETFRPASVRIDDAITALGDVPTKGYLYYIENRLRLLKTVEPVKDRFKFLLDPLAEYLAGLHILDLYGEDEAAWHQFLAAADQKEGAPATTKGFLLALRDCCLAKGKKANAPAFVATELAKRAGLDPEVLKQAQLDQRINRLIQQLEFPLVEDRISSAKDLGEIGPKAKAALPALIQTLQKDEDGGVRARAAGALGNIGPEAKEVVSALIEALKDEDGGVRARAAEALRKINTPAAQKALAGL